MLHLVWSPDVNLLEEGIQACAADLKKRIPALKEFRIDPDEMPLEEIPARLRSQNLFGDVYLYLLPLLGKEHAEAGLFNNLLEWIQAGDHRHAFLFGVVEPFKHPLWEHLATTGRLHKVEAIRKEEDWQKFGGGVVDRFLSGKKLRLSTEARRQLLHRCHLNPARLNSELAKLGDYASGEIIQAGDVERIVGDEYHEDFALLNAIQTRDPRALRKEMRRMLEEPDKSPDMILSTLAGELRLYLLLKSVLPPGERVLDQHQFLQRVYPRLKVMEKDFAAVEERYGRRLKSGYALFHVYKAVAQYSAEDLKRLLAAISEANIRLRQGVPVDHLLSRVVFALAPRPQTTRS